MVRSLQGAPIKSWSSSWPSREALLSSEAGRVRRRASSSAVRKRAQRDRSPPNILPTSIAPIGRPSLLARGRDIAGWPVTSNGAVLASASKAGEHDIQRCARRRQRCRLHRQSRHQQQVAVLQCGVIGGAQNAGLVLRLGVETARWWRRKNSPTNMEFSSSAPACLPARSAPRCPCRACAGGC
jgi:hypothetical protein